MEVLAERQIPVEINITSNIRTGCCPSFEEHPVRDYFDSGLMVTLNSDDPPMFGSNLLEEYQLAHDRFGFSLDQLRELAANAVEASFLPPERKLLCWGRSSGTATRNSFGIFPVLKVAALQTTVLLSACLEGDLRTRLALPRT